MPITKCAVVGCGNSLVKTLCSDDADTLGIQYHDFPDDQDIKKKWIVFCRIVDSEWDPDISHICSTHFTTDDYESDEEVAKIMGHSVEKKILKETAVPSLLSVESIGQYQELDSTSFFESHENESYLMETEVADYDHIKSEDRSILYQSSGNENSDSEDDSQEYEERYSKRRKIYDDWEFRIISCELCSREFSRKYALEHHLSRIHNLSKHEIESHLQRCAYFHAKNYRCDTCKRIFYKADKLECHICEPAVAVLCEICQQKFTSKTGLKRHLSVAHKLERARVVSIMGELSGYNSKFYKKFKVPEDIVISSSDGRVVTKQGDSQFKAIDGTRCITCFKAFQEEFALQSHKCELTIEVTCRSCQYKAPTKYNLKRHLILRHKLSNVDINLVLNELRSYSEKWFLRTPEGKLVKKIQSKRHHKDFKSFIKEEKYSNSDIDGMHSFSNSDKTCTKCNITFKSLFLLRKHKCGIIRTEVNAKRKLLCEICQSEFPLRIALKRHLESTHNLDADAVEAFLERTLCADTSTEVHSPEVNSDFNVPKEEFSCKVNLISDVIKPIDCEICNQKLHSKKDLKWHLLNCFKMDESTLNSIFEESEDYYANFYGNEDYDIVLSSSDGRIVCIKKNSELDLVPGPRCMKCKKAFEDEFKIVGHTCASSITIICNICNSFSGTSKPKLIRHVVNVHKKERSDVEALLEEFKGFNTRFQLRSKNPYQYRSTKKEVNKTLKNIKKENSLSESENLDSFCSSEFKIGESIKAESDSEQDISTIESMQRHLVSYNNKKSFSKRKVLSSSQPEVSIDQNFKEIVCEICKRRFGRKISLKKHLSVVHSVSRSDIDEYVKKISFESAANFKCDVCKKQFYRESRLASHDCTPAIAVVCEICQQKVSSKISLRRHLLLAHELEESQVDSILEELSGFNAKFYKKIQIEGDEIAISSSDGRTIHKENGCRFKMNFAGRRCNICYKAYNDEESETTHECALTITLMCDICKYTAPSKYNLRRHLILIHKISQNEARLALEEFNRYSEKLELRDSLVV